MYSGGNDVFYNFSSAKNAERLYKMFREASEDTGSHSAERTMGTSILVDNESHQVYMNKGQKFKAFIKALRLINEDGIF